jgi:CHAD domain-containing protein
VTLPDPRTALAAELAHALALLSGRRTLDDRAAHALRRSTKRARTLLRLVREAVGERAYRRENRALRDAARTLSPLREARVLLQTLARIDALRDPALAPLRRDAAAALRRPHAVAPLEAALAATSERTGRWRVPRALRPMLASGLERIYRRGRKALRNAAARGSEPSLHELRKQVKHLGVAIAFLEPAGVKGARKLRKRAERIAADLGEEHDLAVLVRRARGRALSAALRSRVAARRSKLAQRALEDARRLYREKPRRLVERLAHEES